MNHLVEALNLLFCEGERLCPRPLVVVEVQLADQDLVLSLVFLFQGGEYLLDHFLCAETKQVDLLAHHGERLNFRGRRLHFEIVDFPLFFCVNPLSKDRVELWSNLGVG